MTGAEPRRPHTSLPGPMIDLIRDGVSEADLRRRGSAAVWGALVSTAMSAMQHGHNYPEWAYRVSERASLLGLQAHRDGRKRDLGRTRYESELQRAWAAAARSVAEEPACTPAQVREGVSKALVALDQLPDDYWTLRPRDRSVLRWVLTEADRRGMTRPAVPVRAVEEATGVPRSEVSRALRRLRESGWLRLHTRGRKYGPTNGPGTSPPAASLYTVAPQVITRLLREATRIPEPPTGAYVPDSSRLAPPMSQGTDSTPVPNTPTYVPSAEEAPMLAVITDPATGQVTALVPPGELPAAVRAGVEALRAAGIAVATAPGAAAAPTPPGATRLDDHRRVAGGGQ